MAFVPGSKVTFTDEVGEDHVATIDSIDGPKHILSYTDKDAGLIMTRTVYGTDKLKPATAEGNVSGTIDTPSERVHEGQKEGRRLSVKLQRRLSLQEREEERKKHLESKTQFQPAKREKKTRHQHRNARKGKPLKIPKRRGGHAALADGDQKKTHLLTKAEITIAKYVRRMLVKKRIHRWHASATVIERHWRGSMEREKMVIRCAAGGNIGCLKVIAKHVKIDLVRDREGRSVLHICCQAAVHSQARPEEGKERFKCAAWICHVHPKLLDVKNREGLTGNRCWQYLCASKIQAGMRGMKTRRVVVFKCARLGRIGVLKAIFRQGRTSPYIKDSRGRTILHSLAGATSRSLAAKGVEWVLKKFKELGSVLDKDKRSPLHIAALSLNSQGVEKVDPVVDLLISKHGGDILSVDRYKHTAFDYIVSSGDLRTFLYMVERNSGLFQPSDSVSRTLMPTKQRSIWMPYNQFQRSRCHQFATGSEGFSDKVLDQGYRAKRESMYRFGFAARRNIRPHVSQPLAHVEQYQNVSMQRDVGDQSFPFKDIVAFERDNAYVYGASCAVLPSSKFKAYPETFSLYFEISFSEDFLRKKNPSAKTIMRAGISFDSDWKALTDTELIGELEYEDNDFSKGQLWYKAYKHKGVHPADFKGTGFVLPSDITAKDVVGCGWNCTTREMFLSLNGKIIETAALAISDKCGVRPGFSCNVSSRQYIGSSEQSYVRVNFGQQPYVFVPAWVEKLKRTRILSETPALGQTARIRGSGNVAGSCFGNSSGIVDWVFAVEKQGKIPSGTQCQTATGASILLAAQNDDVAEVEKLLKEKKDLIFAKDTTLKNHIANIAVKDANAFVEQQIGLVDGGSVVKYSGRNIFHFAALSGRTEVLKFLLRYRIPGLVGDEAYGHNDLLFQGDSELCTPLHLAARCDNLAALRTIREYMVGKESKAFMRDSEARKPTAGRVRESKRARSSARERIALLRKSSPARWSPTLANALQARSHGGMNVMHHALSALSVRCALWTLKQFPELLGRRSHGKRTASLKRRWAASGGAPIHYACNAMLGILPFGTPRANAINYQRLDASLTLRRDVAISMMWKMAHMSDKASIVADSFDRTAHGLLQAMLKELKRAPSSGSVSSYILPSMSDSAHGIKVACTRSRDILKAIYDRSIEEKWEKVFHNPHDAANDALAQANREEAELKEIEERMLAEKKRKKLAIAQANKLKVAAMTERVRLAKQRRQLAQEVEEERKALYEMERQARYKKEALVAEAVADAKAVPKQKVKKKKAGGKKNKKKKRKRLKRSSKKPEDDIDALLNAAMKEKAPVVAETNDVIENEEEVEEEADDVGALFGAGGGDESAPPVDSVEQGKILKPQVPNVSISPRNKNGIGSLSSSGGNFSVHDVNSDEIFAINENADPVNRAAPNDTPRRKWKAKEPKNPFVAKCPEDLKHLTTDELNRLLNQLLVNEDIVNQARRLTTTMNSLGTDNFGLCIDALDHAYDSLKAAKCLPTVLETEIMKAERLEKKEAPFLSKSWSHEYTKLIENKTFEIPDRVLVRSKYLEQSRKFEVETQRLVSKLSMYSAKVEPSQVSKTMLGFAPTKSAPMKSPIQIAEENKSKTLAVELGIKKQREDHIKACLSKTQGMKNWAERIRSMRNE